MFNLSQDSSVYEYYLVSIPLTRRTCQAKVKQTQHSVIGADLTQIVRVDYLLGIILLTTFKFVCI